MEPGLTTFVGRGGDVSRVVSLLRDPRIRLLTISGPGGIGKTRLAHAVLLEVGDDFADGVAVVPLDPVVDPELVVPTIAHALGLRETHDEPLTALEEHVSDRQLLLVLDTFEHLVEAGPALVELLGACPDLKILVTSRIRLRVSVEHELVLEPLSEDASVALFRDRARAVYPEQKLDADGTGDIAEICAKLDGLPLAIELAAARVKVLPPQVMRERLEHRLELLTAGPRDRPDRQRTLRATIDWSFELLDEHEQELFRRLSVFVGGFTLDAVQSVAGGGLDALGSLVDKSLVRSERGRYRMLDTVREYAVEQLDAQGDASAAQLAHAGYFAELAETAEPELSGPDQAAWRERLEAEHGNLRAALRFSLDHGHAETALRLGAALWSFWFEHGYLNEGRAWLDEVLATGGPASSSERARALAGAGFLAHYQGDYARAEALSAEGLSVARQLDDAKAIAAALTGLALVARTRGRSAEADTLFGEALEIYEELGDREGVARTLLRRAIGLSFVEEYDEALLLLRQSSELSRALGDAAGAAEALYAIGYVTAFQGDLETPRRLYDECLAIRRELGDRRSTAKVLWALGDLACELGDHAAAAPYLEESLTLLIEFGDRWFAALALESAADAALGVGDTARAARLYGAGAAQLEELGVPLHGRFRARHERHLEEARARLGTDRFDTAWHEGRALPLRSTVDLVQPAEPAHAYERDRPEGLTPREVEVLSLVAEGLTDAQIAERLVVSLRTVHAHLRSIYRKLDIHSRSAATRYAVEHGLVGDAA